jgi:hypothetical protein
VIPPPVFPDVAHVANGCYLSAVVYLAKFSAAFPAERGEPAAFVLPNAGGGSRPHTLAIMTWQGAWWARDEYFGVIPLGLTSAAPWDPRQAHRRAEAGFRQEWERRRRQPGGVRREVAPSRSGLTPEWRLAEILAARRLLPFPSEVYWLGEGRDAVPFLYFRPTEEGFGVYDPAMGTASALAEVRDGGRIVAAVAERMGYPAGRSPAGRGQVAVLAPAGEGRVPETPGAPRALLRSAG